MFESGARGSPDMKAKPHDPQSLLKENMEENTVNDISEIPHSVVVPSENGGAVPVNHNRITPPLSVVWTTILYCAEFIGASVLSSCYHDSDDIVWMSLTITFILVPSVVTQLTLTFVHRDLGRDRPLVLFMHLLQLGPIYRCIEALVIYCKAGREEESFTTLTRKSKLKNGKPVGLPMEWEIGQSERKLAAHRNAFKRTAVIQAFLGSTPQLTLQLYATVQEKYLLPARAAVMLISLVSITYGALVCSVLAIQIRYDDYKVTLKPGAYLCIVLWRGLEIATRIMALVLFTTALTYWVIPLGLASMLFFFFQPWVEFWARRASLPENVENELSKVGTAVVLCFVTFLYACINVFCWSAVQLNLADHDLIEKQPRWSRLSIYYALRFAENVALIFLWYFFKSDFYEYVCAPLLVVQLIVCYGLAVLFMLLFYQFCHPARKLLKHNVEDCLRCVCCRRKSQSLDEHLQPTQTSPPPPPYQPGERETDILEDTMEAA